MMIFKVIQYLITMKKSNNNNIKRKYISKYIRIYICLVCVNVNVRHTCARYIYCACHIH